MLGISFDSVADNRFFAEAYGYTFPLLCDVDKQIGMAYRACDSAQDAYPRRITYVIGPDGRIERAIETKNPAGQAAELLQAL